MTDKNTIKNWFKTTLKPTQEQFWAWIDSFWHKDEKIPTEQVEGLSEILSDKADATMLEMKSNKDATGLSEDNIIAWKQALNVGELPSNIATVDEDAKAGNVYKKTQVDAFLENSGKNIGNTDLSIPAGTVRILNTTGAKLQITGLEDKGNDSAFDKKLKINDAGELAVSNEADITLNVPDTFTGSASLGSTTINVNHIFPEQIPERPPFTDEIQQIMSNYKNISFIPITQSQWTLWTKENQGLAVNVIDSNGNFSLNANHSDFNVFANTDLVVALTGNIVLPNDRNWILKIKGSITTHYGGGEIYTGVSRHSGDNTVFYGVETSSYASIRPIGSSGGFFLKRTNFLCLIVKVGGVIFTSIYNDGKNLFNTLNGYLELGDYIPKIIINKGNGTINGSMSYKIFN